jgi:hypothetical protein
MDWINDVYCLNDDDAVYLIITKMDDLFLMNNFEECDRLLRLVDFTRLNTCTVVGFLAATFAARLKLNYRKEFVILARNRLLELAPHRVDRLMDGLE